jgi:glucokinase
MEATMILAGDIGGTKTALALYSPDTGPRQPLAQATFPSGDYASLEDIVRTFITDQDARVSRASFGVAGPVVGEHAQVTNLPWFVDAQALSSALGGVSVRLLNDLAAIANAIPFLEPSDLATLNPGQPEHHGPVAIIAPGTGLGEAYMLWEGSRYRPHASEGGHVDFGPTSQLEIELLSYLRPRFDHVSYERVCSGIGIPNLYAFLKDSGNAFEPEWLSRRLAEAADPNPVIMQAAMEQHTEICVKTLELFVSILGNEAGNLTLKILATGGVYLGGGIPLRILSKLQEPAFMQSFTRRGRFSDLLTRVPVHVILHPQVALLGVACHALEL